MDKYTQNEKPPEQVYRTVQQLYLAMKADSIEINQKESIIQNYITNKINNDLSVAECGALFDMALNWMKHDDKKVVQLGAFLFLHMGMMKENILITVFTPRLLSDFFASNMYPQKSVVLNLVTKMLLFLTDSTSKDSTQSASDAVLTVQSHLNEFLSQSEADESTLEEILDLLCSFPLCIPVEDDSRLTCYVLIINLLGQFEPPTKGLAEYQKKMHSFAQFLVTQMTKYLTTEKIVGCLQVIYEQMTSPEGARGLGFAAILNVMPAKVIRHGADTINSRSTDAQVIRAMITMCNWLCLWSKHFNLKTWILVLIHILENQKRFTVLHSVAEATVEKLFSMLRVPVYRAAVAPVVFSMLQGYQSRPDLFHKILKHVVPLINGLTQQQDMPVLNELIKTLHALMFCHDGYPDLYENIIKVLQDYPKPEKQDVKRILAQHCWPVDCPPEPGLPDGQVVPTSLHNKTGLVNIGNTCYMNCVLQALFMTDEFHSQVLQAKPSSDELLLKCLQTVFAFLRYTCRSSYKPNSFHHASRPPGFEIGRQQDCSEFQKYLLLTMHEQTKKLNLKKKPISSCTSTDFPQDMDTTSVHDSYTDSEVMDIGDDNSGMRRWTTREDLTENNLEQSLSCGYPKSQSGDVFTCDQMSSPYSNSTDSGIQSVGESTEEFCEEGSLVHLTFGCTISTTCKCLACETESVKKEIFTDLDLAFPEATTRVGNGYSLRTQEPRDTSVPVLELQELINYYFEVQRLEGTNKYQCAKCDGLQDGVISKVVTHTPEHLILTLMRFQYDKETNRRSKLSVEVHYPDVIQLPFRSRNQDGHDMKTEAYFLYACIVHSGVDLDGGHYYTYARNSSHIEDNGQWFVFNDAQVNSTTYESFRQLSRRSVEDTPYVLFYRKASRSAPVSIPEIRSLSFELRDALEKDNMKYAKEKAVKKVPAATGTPTKEWRYSKDDDDDPPSFVGGGCGFGAPFAPGRYVC